MSVTRRVLMILGATLFLLSLPLFIEPIRTFVVIFFRDIFLFLEHHISTILAAFFLVNGKFILKLFLKKIILLSVTGLSKRYLIEKVLNYHLKIHLLDHLKADMERLFHYTKENFRNFPIIKQFIAVVIFISSLSVVGKFMGGMLAMKVFIAKFWSFILGIVLKFSTAVVYFFTDYLWGSWIAPLIEILIFSWILSLLERVPFLKRHLERLYRIFMATFIWIEEVLERFLHLPLKRLLRRIVKWIQRYIHRFIGYQRPSVWRQLQIIRQSKPSVQRQLQQKRARFQEGRVYRKSKINAHHRIVQRRLEKRR
jgi:hypothetical protein